jgi:hypothetical protein
LGSGRDLAIIPTERMMLTAGDKIRVESAAAPEVLQSAVVKEKHGGRLLAEFEEEVHFAAGTALSVYHREDTSFVKSSASVLSILRSGGRPLVHLLLASASEPAERRECFRVCVAAAAIFVTANEHPCELIDVSADGIALICRSGLPHDRGVLISFCEREQTYTGEAIVRSVRPLSNSKFRYGLLVCEGQKELHTALRQTSMRIQREQLQRLRAALQ